MGLLEKALEYKREMNRNGKETIMDKIAGPADTGFVEDKPLHDSKDQPVASESKEQNQTVVNDDDLVKLDPSELIAVDEDSLDQPVEAKTESSDTQNSSDKENTKKTSGEDAAASYSTEANSQPIYDELEPEDLVILEDDEPALIDQDNLIIDELETSENVDMPEGSKADEEQAKDNQEELLASEPEQTSDFPDSDLFDLPDDIDESIDDTLQNQKKQGEDTEITKEAGQHQYDQQIVDEPLGADDLPVLDPTETDVSQTEVDNAEPAGVSVESVEDGLGAEDFPENFDTSDKPEESIESHEPEDVVPVSESEHKYNDFMILYESGREILQAASKDELFDTILFSIMGQLGVSSASILVPGQQDKSKWVIAESRGVTIADHGLFFSANDGILSDIVSSKETVDLEDYRDKHQYRDDYYKYISIDARLAVPLVYDGEVVGVVFLGEKLTSEEYSVEDKDFVYSIGEFAAVALRNVLFKGKKFTELDSLEKDIEYMNEIDQVREKIISESGIDQVEEIIREEFINLGIEIFSIVLKEEKDRYVPQITEKEDILQLFQNEFKISSSNYFINYILESEVPVDVNLKNPILVDVFTKDQISNMSLCRVYPFKIGRSFLGFIIINRIADLTALKEIDEKLKRFSDVIFPYLLNIRNIETTKNKYIDNVDHVYKRINSDLANARNLNIPLTLVLFSIKNYKRYYHLFGYSEVKNLINSFEKIIISKLSDGDFSVRHDRHKILVVLPGKDKKYAVPFASSICNEIVSLFKKPEIQLLVTYLTAEYPEDGEDLYSLIDAVD